MNRDPRVPPDERRAWRTDLEWNRLRERIETADLLSPTPPPHGWRRWAIAAAIIVVVAGASLVLTHRDRTELRSMATAVGERKEIRLPDSSVVTLGPRTALRYRFTMTRREVDVEGLAAFTVVHDSTRPFVVRAKNAVTTDLGTSFIVRAYAADSGVEVSVTSGVVSLGGSSHSVALRAGEAGRVSVSGVVSTDVTRPARDTAWIQGRLAFDGEPLADVAAELERWFDVEIRVPDPVLARRRLSAVYNSPTLAGVVDAITVTLGAHAERSGRVVTILPGSR
jgi:transmembrane sensor